MNWKALQWAKKQTKRSKPQPASGKKKRLKPKLTILSTDTTQTSHSSGSVAQEAHVPITTFVVVWSKVILLS